MRCCYIVFYISHNCCNISAYCHHDNFRRHSIPMACHNTLVIPSACAIGVVTPSSYSLNIMIGYYHGHQFDQFDAFASSDADASVSIHVVDDDDNVNSDDDDDDDDVVFLIGDGQAHQNLVTRKIMLLVGEDAHPPHRHHFQGKNYKFGDDSDDNMMRIIL